MNRSEKNLKKILRLSIAFSFIGIIVLVATYAWFIGMRAVKVFKFDVDITSADSLLLSLDGENWSLDVNISEETYNDSAYDGNTNTWAGKGLIPMSSAGEVDATVSRLKIFEKAGLTRTPGGYRLMASRVDNHSNPTIVEPDGYIVFDLFIKNFSGTQYIEELNESDEEAIYLKLDSAVTVSESGVANTGIENSVRVAFVQIGRVIGTSVDVPKIIGISCVPAQGSGVTGICRPQIWEPNDKAHGDNAIRWYDKSCVKRIGLDVNSAASYEGPCEMVSDGTSYPTYAVSGAVASADNVDVYDGAEYNDYTGSSSFLSSYDYFTDTEKLLVGAERPAFMNLALNSITKLRIYIYIEGQDIDNYDFASIGKLISVNFGFTKNKFEEE